MEKIEIGKIVNAVGIKGEIKIYSYAESPEIYSELEDFYIENEKCKIENTRYKGDMPIVKVSNINTRNEAEALKNKSVFIAESQLPQLSEGEHYVKDIIGFTVVEGEKTLGKLKDINKNTMQPLYVVSTEEKDILIPGVDEFILDINIKEKKIIVKLPEGLLEI